MNTKLNKVITHGTAFTKKRSKQLSGAPRNHRIFKHYFPSGLLSWNTTFSHNYVKIFKLQFISQHPIDSYVLDATHAWSCYQSETEIIFFRIFVSSISETTNGLSHQQVTDSDGHAPCTLSLTASAGSSYDAHWSWYTRVFFSKIIVEDSRWIFLYAKNDGRKSSRFSPRFPRMKT